jgi:hypothetical protein
MFRLPLSRWVTLWAAGGCVMLLIDAQHAHHFQLPLHRWAWTPLVYAPLGILAYSAAGLRWRVWSIRLAQAVASLGLIVGLLGLYFHNEDRVGSMLEAREQVQVTGLGELAAVWLQRYHADEHPVLAPTSFAGIGALILLAGQFGVRRLRPEAGEAEPPQAEG